MEVGVRDGGNPASLLVSFAIDLERFEDLVSAEPLKLTNAVTAAVLWVVSRLIERKRSKKWLAAPKTWRPMRLVRIDTLEPGACLARDVSWGHTVVPQLRAGVVLTAQYLERLRQAGLSQIYVHDPADAADGAPEVVQALTRLENAEALAPGPAWPESVSAPAAEHSRPVTTGRTESRLRRIAHTLTAARAVRGLHGA